MLTCITTRTELTILTSIAACAVFVTLALTTVTNAVFTAHIGLSWLHTRIRRHGTVTEFILLHTRLADAAIGSTMTMPGANLIFVVHVTLDFAMVPGAAFVAVALTRILVKVAIPAT